MKKYKLTLAYDGTHYGGWQVQINSLCIQKLVQHALETILRAPTSLTGSSRTDAGVHALGQTAHFTSEDELNLSRTLLSLNALLPTDIRVLDIQEVSLDFHARYSATGKTYHYHLHLAPSLNPFTHLYTTQIKRKINLSLLIEAASQFIGTHDFTSFANEAHTGSASRDPVRTLRRLDVIEHNEEVRLEFEGDGFLYRQVRNITGTLLEVASGKITPSSIPELFAAKNRSKVKAATAPPQGLFLVHVHYDLRKSDISSNEG